jgi:hypothetical protein
MWWPLVFYTLYASCAGLAESGITQCAEKVAELVPPDAPADVSPTDLAFCWAIFAGLFEPPGSREKQKEIKPPRLPPLSWCLGIIASLDDSIATQHLWGCCACHFLNSMK